MGSDPQRKKKKKKTMSFSEERPLTLKKKPEQ